jgi:hypothetical protein
MGKTPVILIMAFIILAIALGGCASPAQRIVVTVGPTAAPVLETITPSPTPGVARPTVIASGGLTTAGGSEDQIIKGIKLGEGVYAVNWSGSGTFVSFSLTDINGNGGADIPKGRTSGERLLIVDDSTVLPGDFTLMVASDSDWVINIFRPDTSTPSLLPLAVSCGEPDGAVTKPFRAHAGDLKISYTLSRTPYGTGHVDVYDVNTGRSFYTRPITDGAVAGQSIAIVPADGVYIAQVTLPEGASYADITISQ